MLNHAHWWNDILQPPLRNYSISKGVYLWCLTPIPLKMTCDNEILAYVASFHFHLNRTKVRIPYYSRMLKKIERTEYTKYILYTSLFCKEIP